MIIITTHLKKTERNFREKYVLISNYTSHLQDSRILSGLINSEFDSLLRHFSKVLEIEANFQGFPSIKQMTDNPSITTNDYVVASTKVNKNLIEKNLIYDFNYSYINSSKLELIRKLNKYKIEKKGLGKEIVKNKEKYSEKTNLKMSQELQEYAQRIENIEKNIQRLDQDTNTVIDDIFITFRNQKIAYVINSAYDKSKCTRCCYIMSCKYSKIKHLYYKNKWLDLKETKDQPSNINWNNLAYNKWLRYLRVLLSYLIAIIIIVSSFGVVIGSKYALQQVTDNYNPDIDCKYINQTDYLSQKKVFQEFTDTNIKNGTKYLTYCYCNEKLMTNGPMEISNTMITESNKTILPCKSWFESYLKYNSVNIAIVIVIPIVNSLLVIVLRIFSSFEKSKTLTHEMTSVMWKIFVLQMINSGIVIVIVNMKIDRVKSWNSSFPLFTGRFSDMDPGWYGNVGVSIVILYLFFY